MRVAWCSPLPKPALSCGSTARYISSLLVPHLAKKLDIELFDLDKPAISPQTRSIQNLTNIKYTHYLNAFKRDQQKPFDIFFYQLEDHPASYLMRGALATHPGLVWVHDFTFSKPNLDPFQHSTWKQHKKIFTDLIDGQQPDFPERVGEYDQQQPYAVREIGFSIATLYSSFRHIDSKTALAAENLSNTQGQHLPLPVSRELLRYTMPDQHVIGFCGDLSSLSRAEQLLSAIARVSKKQCFYWLIEQNQKEAAEKLVQKYGLSGVEYFWPRTPERWQQILPKISIAAHTHYPDFGQPGIYMAMSLMAGRNCIANTFSEADSIPNNVLFKVHPGQNEIKELELLLKSLLRTKPAISSLARAYAEDMHSSDAIAAELIQYLMQNKELLIEKNQEVRSLSKYAKQVVAQESLRFYLDPAPALSELNQATQSEIKAVFQEFNWG